MSFLEFFAISFCLCYHDWFVLVTTLATSHISISVMYIIESIPHGHSTGDFPVSWKIIIYSVAFILQLLFNLCENLLFLGHLASSRITDDKSCWKLGNPSRLRSRFPLFMYWLFQGPPSGLWCLWCVLQKHVDSFSVYHIYPLNSAPYYSF